MGGIIKEACCIAVAAVIAAAAMPACTSSRNGCWSVSIVDNGIAGTLQSQPASTTAYEYHHSHTTTPRCHAGEVCRGVCGGNDYIIEKKFFLRPMSDDSASDAAEAYASWVRHLRAASCLCSLLPAVKLRYSSSYAFPPKPVPWTMPSSAKMRLCLLCECLLSLPPSQVHFHLACRSSVRACTNRFQCA